jgi:hypothetical protein
MQRVRVKKWKKQANKRADGAFNSLNTLAGLIEKFNLELVRGGLRNQFSSIEPFARPKHAFRGFSHMHLTSNPSAS